MEFVWGFWKGSDPIPKEDSVSIDFEESRGFTLRGGGGKNRPDNVGTQDAVCLVYRRSDGEALAHRDTIWNNIKMIGRAVHSDKTLLPEVIWIYHRRLKMWARMDIVHSDGISEVLTENAVPADIRGYLFLLGE